MKNSLAKKIGVFLAHIQGFFDELFRMIFKSLRNKNTKDEDKKYEDSSKLKSVVKKSANFIGEMGDSYYEKYEDIKSKQKEQRKKD